MASVNRRDFGKWCLATAGAGAATPLLSATEPAIQHGPFLGRVRPRPSRSIAASPLGVGFETLDRRMFDPERTYEHLAALGVKWARVQTGWSRCETAKGTFDFTWLDRVVDSIVRAGVQPWFNLGYGNQLYTPDAPDSFAVGWVPLRSVEARRAWVRFVRALAEHFRGRVRHWEIWNEPDIKMFWKPEKPSPEGYVELVRLTAPVLRAAVPNAVLVGGAFSDIHANYPLHCLELGLAQHVDRLSYHPYQLLPEAKYEQRVTALRALLKRYKPSLALWQGECGCPSQEGGVGALSWAQWTENRQAKWLLRRTLNDLRLQLELISYFHLVDLVRYTWARGPGTADHPAASKAKLGAYFGLLRGDDYTRKPSYYAYQNLAALFDSQTERADLPLDLRLPASAGEPLASEKLYQASFVRNGRPLLAYWYAGDVQKDFQARPIDISVSNKAFNLTTPVLIDPLSGEIRRIEGTTAAGRWTWLRLPLADYPLLISDKDS